MYKAKFLLLRIGTIFFNKKMYKFIIGGALAYFINISLTLFLTEVLRIYYLLSYSLAFIVVILFNFFFNTFVIFQVKEDRFKRFFPYISSVLIFTLINIILVKIVTEYIGLYYLYSIIIITAVLFLTKFVLYDNYIFSSRGITQR